jgi:hypothetical protein
MTDRQSTRAASRTRQGGLSTRPPSAGSGLPSYRPMRSPLVSMGPSLDEERRRHRTARLIAVTSVVVVTAVVLLVWVIGLLGREVVSETDTNAATGATAAVSTAAPIEQTGPPTPQTLAQTVVDQGSTVLRLQLPIRREAVTGIGYGPRRQHGAIELEPTGTRANTSWLRRTTQRFLATTPAGDLRWYRLADGEPSMVTVGALPGTEVYAPIDGKVLTISPYEIAGEARGVLVQLQPVGDGSTVVVLRNLEPSADLAVGRTVTQSVTRIGTVRDMQGAIEAPLADYTHDSGSVIDMYVLRLDVPTSSLG